MLEQLKEISFLKNSLLDYLLVVGYFICGSAVYYVLKSFLLKHLRRLAEKTETDLDDMVLELVDKYLSPAVYLGIFYFSFQTLELTNVTGRVLTIIIGIIATYYIVRVLTSVVRLIAYKFWIKKYDDSIRMRSHFEALMPFVAGLIWLGAGIFLLDNLGFDISALVAGLGIGGVAVGFAASAVLKDLFSYFTIIFDEPFVVGDFIIVGDYLGTIEKIGIKSTRIRSLGGELLIFSNADLTDSRIRNYKRMEERRILFKLGVTYDTTTDQIKNAPQIVKEIIEGVKETRFDRAHFSKFGNYNLELEVVYYVLDRDYNKYMDIQQEINFKIKDAFSQAKLEFAFPTQTIYAVTPNNNESGSKPQPTNV